MQEFKLQTRAPFCAHKYPKTFQASLLPAPGHSLGSGPFPPLPPTLTNSCPCSCLDKEEFPTSFQLSVLCLLLKFVTDWPAYLEASMPTLRFITSALRAYRMTLKLDRPGTESLPYLSVDE